MERRVGGGGLPIICEVGRGGDGIGRGMEDGWKRVGEEEDMMIARLVLMQVAQIDHCIY